MKIVHIALACLIASLAVVGLAAPARAVVPLTASTADGVTFSGVDRSVASDGSLFEETIGPFTQSGHQESITLYSTVAEDTDYPTCDPDAPTVSRSETIINQITYHFTVDISSTPGNLISFRVVLTSFNGDGTDTTTVFPLNEIEVSATVGDEDDEFFTVIPLIQGSAPPGTAAAYNGVINTPIEVPLVIPINVTFSGEVPPELSGNPDQTPLNCPTPNDDLNLSSDVGLSQAVITDTFLQLVIEELPPPPSDQPQVIISSDPVYPGEILITVTSTAGDDTIEVMPVQGSDEVNVHVNGDSLGHFPLSNRIVINGQDGDDIIMIVEKLKAAIWAYGGPGDDNIISDKNETIMIGGSGNDLIRGGNKRDILIGGTGSDLLLGQNGSDLLIDGTTSFDATEAALAALLAEWNASRGYKQRVSNIVGETTGGLNGTVFLLPGTTVQNDSIFDSLLGGNSKDLFFASSSDFHDAASPEDFFIGFE